MAKGARFVITGVKLYAKDRAVSTTTSTSNATFVSTSLTPNWFAQAPVERFVAAGATEPVSRQQDLFAQERR